MQRTFSGLLLLLPPLLCQKPYHLGNWSVRLGVLLRCNLRGPPVPEPVKKNKPCLNPPITCCVEVSFFFFFFCVCVCVCMLLFCFVIFMQ
jgi:hypothetical protein